MNSRIIMAFAAVLALGSAGFSQTSTAVAYTYTTLAFPGATSSTAIAINNHNAVVGTYSLGVTGTHSFLWQNGTFTTIDFPGASSTYASGINDFGDIVGTYVVGNFQSHGFLRHNGAFTTIDFPGFAGASGATGINNSGVIVGNYGNSQGYVLTNGTFKTLNAPQLNSGEAIDTELESINNQGWITGRVFTGDNWRGFWYVNGEFDFLEPPFSLDNVVSGSNGHGDIVGCEGGATSFLSFAVESNEGTESPERFPTIEVLNPPSGICPTGINYARVIVGGSYMGVPALTLNVTSPVNHGTYSNPVHVAASASGVNPISQIQVWLNSKEVYHVSGLSLTANLTLAVGNNERFVVQAIDSKGMVAKVVESITVK